MLGIPLNIKQSFFKLMRAISLLIILALFLSGCELKTPCSVEYTDEQDQLEYFYIGSCKTGNVPHGEGVYRSVNTDDEGFWTYSGQVNNDKFHGEGIYEEKDYRLEGIWKDDELNGFGREKTKNSYYEGGFLNGKYEGEGKVTFNNGDSYEGSWSSGMRHGKGKVSKSNGDFYTGRFRQDIFLGGEGTVYIENNGCSTIMFGELDAKDGEPVGFKGIYRSIQEKWSLECIDKEFIERGFAPITSVRGNLKHLEGVTNITIKTVSLDSKFVSQETDFHNGYTIRATEFKGKEPISGAISFEGKDCDFNFLHDSNSILACYAVLQRQL